MKKIPRVEGTIAFDRDKYKTEEEFYAEIGKQLDILAKQDYIVRFRYECSDIYILDYCYDNNHTEYGADRFLLVTLDEEEEVLSRREFDDQETPEENNGEPEYATYTIKNDDN